mmetsp:Transcript_15639/g.23548  ORF Transcript_15639/g.23548 Transcript_15639/m.23548 type:complete len:706 (+) Transcript_15639:44-2161(+)|eukprot:CAMPEP_0197310574 /NCGR_PEP_ID=MMETSP0891-20130614/9139_1 /TAXON_ID=44058 ORGANISM="Aureoumbra lagunensis, Strain CCMP1510" /NCGR_SAMPLE_ID=MMETSP0891 /ASSEMBLY_ACC=CAM_ASM_000534 /LENGTH=705 /DNA_ID=CAMNT_0042796271 /DNA_START=38 /DNA_END=2155 /DNA_ORIENTATION=-
MPVSTYIVESKKKNPRWCVQSNFCSGTDANTQAMLDEEFLDEKKQNQQRKPKRKQHNTQQKKGRLTDKQRLVDEEKEDESFSDAYSDTLGSTSAIEKRISVLEKQFRLFRHHHGGKHQGSPRPLSAAKKNLITPPPPPSESDDPRQTLQWAEDYKRWLENEDDDDEFEEPSIEKIQQEWLDILIANVEQPSIYLLASTPETFGFNRSQDSALEVTKRDVLQNKQEKDEDKSKKKKRRGSRRKRKPGFCRRSCNRIHETLRVTRMHTFIMTTLLLILTYLTIIFPLVMLANFWKRNVNWTDVRVDIDERRRSDRRVHRFYLKVTSAILLAYLFYTSLTILDEVKVFRFFLLGNLPNCDDRLEEELQPIDEEAPETNDTNPNSGTIAMARRLGKKGVNLVKHFGTHILQRDSLLRPILIIGIISKIASLVCVIQLTYLIFRVSDFQIIELILNSVALQFLQQVDATLGTAIKNTPAMTRYFQKAVNELRAEAQHIVDSPYLVHDIVEPSTYSWSQLIRNTISNEYADRLVRKYPRILYWLPHEATATKEISSNIDAPSSSNNQDDGLPRITQNSFPSAGAPPTVEKSLNPKQQKDRPASIAESTDAASLIFFSESRIFRRRICSRSEIVHRVIHNFVIVYGVSLILLQVFGNLFCSWRGICKRLSNQSDNDEEPDTVNADTSSTRRLATNIWHDGILGGFSSSVSTY